MRMRQKIGLNVNRAVLKPVHSEVGSGNYFLCWYRLHSTRQIFSSVQAVLEADRIHHLCAADVQSGRETLCWLCIISNADSVKPVNRLDTTEQATTGTALGTR